MTESTGRAGPLPPGPRLPAPACGCASSRVQEANERTAAERIGFIRWIRIGRLYSIREIVLYNSAEREGERFGSSIQKLDLECAVFDGVLLADQLVQPVFSNLSVSVRVGVYSVVRAGSATVNPHSEANHTAIRWRPQH